MRDVPVAGRGHGWSKLVNALASRLGARPRLSVVAPCYNEEEVLPEFVQRMVAACEGAGIGSFELILVDDGSRDLSWARISAAASKDARVRGVRLSRNFGHQSALTSGLSLATGDMILVIDADLQDPPELLTEMVALLESADVVYGQRSKREGESLFKLASAKLFYRLLSGMAAVDIPVDTGDFRLMRRSVLDALLAMPEQHRFVRGMVAWVGFTQKPIAYERQARTLGVTKYPLHKMVRFALDAITSFSIEPLRIAMWCSFVSGLVAVGMLFYAIASLVLGLTVPGWTSLTLAVAGMGAIQLFCIGMIGEYVGRTYMETKRRPLFVIAEVTNAPSESSAETRARPQTAP